jgi:hypothetical protein
MGTLTFEFETITPEIARRLIEEHDNAVLNGDIINRKRNSANVRRIAGDITAGRWYPDTGDTLKFERTMRTSVTGQRGRDLVDGQTRLAAVGVAGIPIQAWIAYGVARTAFKYIDSGTRRSLKNVLETGREQDAAILAPALQWLTRWDFEAGTWSTSHPGTYAEAMAMLETDPAIRKSAHRVRIMVEKTKSKLLGKGLAAFLHRIFAKDDEDLADAFLDALMTGENLHVGDPYHVFREKLIANSTSRRKILPKELIGLSIKAWNAVREGRRMKQLKFNPGTEAFPVLYGHRAATTTPLEALIDADDPPTTIEATT